jgi:hypothetical protein
MAKVGIETGTLNLIEQAVTPATPDVGYIKIYVKTDLKLYWLDSAGVESALV